MTDTKTVLDRCGIMINVIKHRHISNSRRDHRYSATLYFLKVILSADEITISHEIGYISATKFLHDNNPNTFFFSIF